MESDRYEKLKKALQKQEKVIVKEMVAWGRKPGHSRVERLHAEAETGGSFDDFLKVMAGRSAVRFLLRTVYVRVLEDLELLPEARIRGRRSHEAFRELAPALGYRAYLGWVFRDLAKDFPALFEPSADECPPPSEKICRDLWDLWHEEDGKGNLLYEWRQGGFDSRFLGDLYQDLDGDVRKRFALLQTPDFVESYILDLTMGDPKRLSPEDLEGREVALNVFDPKALRKKGEAFRALDPTCGSGHFLIGAFHRMADYWELQGVDKWGAVELAAESVWGSDINPHAIDIARFRLVLEAVERTGERELNRLASVTWNLRVLDSLVPWEGARGAQHLFPGEDRLAKYASTEERQQNANFLGREFHVVVGNPPYITPKDKQKRADYQVFWPESCHKEYALGAPFIERFFRLAVVRGPIGLIVADTFMTRAFGAPLTTKFLSVRDVSMIVDCSLLRIPGHGQGEGISTCILIGHNALSDLPLDYLGAEQGEPGSAPTNSESPAWQELCGATLAAKSSPLRFFDWVNVPRSRLKKHPWAFGEGPSAKLERLAATSKSVSDFSDSVGLDVITRCKGLFEISRSTARRLQLSSSLYRPLVQGDAVRDFSHWEDDLVLLCPYEGEDEHVVELNGHPGLARYVWYHRFWLARRFVSGGTTLSDAGREFFEIPQFPRKKHKSNLALTWAFLATHNHFTRVNARCVFNRRAPILKCKHEESLEPVALAAVLNSSMFAVWARARCQGRGQTREQWADRIEIDANAVGSMPISHDIGSDEQLCELGEQLLRCAEARDTLQPSKLVRTYTSESSAALGVLLQNAHCRYLAESRRLVALQEEVDWLLYERYGFLEVGSDAAAEGRSVEETLPGHRPFAISLARQNSEGENTTRTEWFSLHQHEETPDIPEHYSDSTRSRIQARLDVIAENKEIRLIEQPQFKRRWQLVDWDKEVKAACESWLLDRLEDLFAPPEDDAAAAPPLADPRPYTLEEIVTRFRDDPRVRCVADSYTGEAHTDLSLLVERLLNEQGIPDHPFRIFTAEGLRKYRQWQDIWALQDREDAGEKLRKPIPNPPEFGKGDFQNEKYLSIRGKLNVPRERFIVFAEFLPPRYGWNGWRDMDRALAQVEVYTAAEQDPLVPLPTPTTEDPRRCGATLGLWESLPDVRRWVGAEQEGELRALAEEACQQKRCPCDVVKVWQKWQAGELEIQAEQEAAESEEVTVNQRAAVLERFTLMGNTEVPIKELRRLWPRSPAELETVLEDLVASGHLTVKGKADRRRFAARTQNAARKS